MAPKENSTPSSAQSSEEPTTVWPWERRRRQLDETQLVVFDECSMIPESIWRATDGFLNDANTQTYFWFSEIP
jgi:hypothetical protein